MARPSLAEKDILNPSEAIDYFVLSRRKFYDLLKNTDGVDFLDTTENASWFFVLHLKNICYTIQSWGGEANGKGRRGQTRRDSKRRVLRPGESVRADGKYQYKYHIDGKPHFVYSWKPESTDKLPKGKKPCLSLRKLEKQVNTDLDLLVNIVDVSVFEGLVWGSGIIPVSCVTTLSEGEKVWKKVEKSIDGYSGFLFYDDNGMPLVAMHWQHRFNHMVGRYNDIYRVQMPNITPHGRVIIRTS